MDWNIITFLFISRSGLWSSGHGTCSMHHAGDSSPRWDFFFFKIHVVFFCEFFSSKFQTAKKNRGTASNNIIKLS